MIPFRFEYYRPDSLEEAGDLFNRLLGENKHPLIYGGGTEILTKARLLQVRPDALIDIKTIPECRRFEPSDDWLTFGAALTLEEICQANPWPLLSVAAGRVADHSTRCKITLGGHLAGTIMYREAALPFMLFPEHAEISIYGVRGLRRVAFPAVFDGELHLASGEFAVDLRVPRSIAGLPASSVKKTRIDWVDYPLFTVTMARTPTGIRSAFSGVGSAPFVSLDVDRALNGPGSTQSRAEQAVQSISTPVLDDLHGSSDYRRFLLAETIFDMLKQLEA